MNSEKLQGWKFIVDALRWWWKLVGAVVASIGERLLAVLLYAIYLVCWMPVGLITRLTVDWLRRRAPERSNWWPRAPRVNDPRTVREQL